MKELLQQALDALEDAVGLHVRWDDAHAETITALREALAAPMPEPGAWQFDIDESNLYHGDALVASFDNTECTNDSWREACRYGVEIAARMNATPPAAPAPTVSDEYDMADDGGCPVCGEDGGTSCGMPNCGLLQGAAPVVPTDAALNTLAKLFHNGEEIESDDGVAMAVDLSLWHEASEAFDSLIGDGDSETLASPAASVVREPIIDEMDAVASRYAHKLALDLECVLSDYNGKWWDTAMQTIGEYRMAMNRIHERESPTHMGEPVLPKISSGVGK